MYKYDIDEAFCERIINIKDGRKVYIYIWKPVKISEIEYVCPYKIDGLEKPVQKCSHGIDSFQSLIITLELIYMYLKESSHAKMGNMSWFEDDVNFGFKLIFDC